MFYAVVTVAFATVVKVGTVVTEISITVFPAVRVVIKPVWLPTDATAGVNDVNVNLLLSTIELAIFAP